MTNLDAEQALENRTMRLFADLGWATANAWYEAFDAQQASASRPYLVKRIARDLLASLLTEKLVLDWRKHQQSRAAVCLTIADTLYDHLPDSYTAEHCDQKRDDVYYHIYTNYHGAGQSLYTAA